jgi:hypothetical protein
MVVAGAFVVRLETVSLSSVWSLVLASAALKESTCCSTVEGLGLSGRTWLRLLDLGTLIPILERIAAATSWALSGRLPVAAAAPVTVATVRPPAAMSALALRSRRFWEDLSVPASVGRHTRNRATAAGSPASSASVAGARAAARTSLSDR